MQLTTNCVIDKHDTCHVYAFCWFAVHGAVFAGVFVCIIHCRFVVLGCFAVSCWYSDHGWCCEITLRMFLRPLLCARQAIALDKELCAVLL